MSHESCASNVNNEISILEVRSPSRRWRHSTLRGALSIGLPKPMRPLAEILTREGRRRPRWARKCLPRRLKRVFLLGLFARSTHYCTLERHFLPHLTHLTQFAMHFTVGGAPKRRNQNRPGQMRKLPVRDDLFAERKIYPRIYRLPPMLPSLLNEAPHN